MKLLRLAPNIAAPHLVQPTWVAGEKMKILRESFD